MALRFRQVLHVVLVASQLFGHISHRQSLSPGHGSTWQTWFTMLSTLCCRNLATRFHSLFAFLTSKTARSLLTLVVSGLIELGLFQLHHENMA